MTDQEEAQGQSTMSCPKDGAAMRQMGRRGGAWRCPDCRSIFIDTEAMRRTRGGQPPAWLRIPVMVLTIVFVSRLARRCRRRASSKPGC